MPAPFAFRDASHAVRLDSAAAMVAVMNGWECFASCVPGRSSCAGGQLHLHSLRNTVPAVWSRLCRPAGCQQSLESIEAGCHRSLESIEAGCHRSLESIEAGCQRSLETIETGCHRSLQSMEAGCQ